MRRNSNHPDLVDIDSAGLAAAANPWRLVQTTTKAEAVLVRHTPYDPSLWLSVDHDEAGTQTAS